jgi:capsular polysaccharide biosynthesis protein
VDVNELVTRLLRRHWIALVLAVALPTLAVGLLVMRQPGTYTAHARILASVTTPRAQAEASALVSQVTALATSRDIVATALTQAGVARSADEVIRDVRVTGLGTSAVVDLAYTDTDAQQARLVAATVARATTDQLDKVRIGGLPDVLKTIDDQLTDLASKRAPLLAAAQANTRDLIAQSRLAGIDRLINDLSGDRNRLAEDSAAVGHASVLASPAVPDGPDPRGLPTKLALAALAGLAFGLIALGVRETLRPTVSGSARVGRLLDAPVLGAVGSDPVGLVEVGRRIRLAARRADVSTVVLVWVTRAVPKPELVDRVEAATLRPAGGSPRVAIPIDSREVRGLTREGTGDGPTIPLARAVSVLTASENHTENHAAPSAAQLHRVCALDELDPGAESERIGVVVLVAASTRLTAVDSLRDLLAASGWPLLGVLGADKGGAW